MRLWGHVNVERKLKKIWIDRIENFIKITGVTKEVVETVPYECVRQLQKATEDDQNNFSE